MKYTQTCFQVEEHSRNVQRPQGQKNLGGSRNQENVSLGWKEQVREGQKRSNIHEPPWRLKWGAHIQCSKKTLEDLQQQQQQSERSCFSLFQQPLWLLCGEWLIGKHKWVWGGQLETPAEMQGRDEGGWRGDGRRWWGAEIKLAKLADGCEEREDSELTSGICLERRGNQGFDFGRVTSTYLRDLQMEMSRWWSDTSVEVRGERDFSRKYKCWSHQHQW